MNVAKVTSRRPSSGSCAASFRRLRSCCSGSPRRRCGCSSLEVLGSYTIIWYVRYKYIYIYIYKVYILVDIYIYIVVFLVLVFSMYYMV